MIAPPLSVDVLAIRRLAARRVRDPDHRDDVVQIACLYAIQTGRSGWRVVADAIRQHFRTEFRAGQLEHVDRVASLYPTRDELVERWHDEETEDQADEWRWLSASDRDRRAAEAARALGTTPITRTELIDIVMRGAA